MKAPFSLNYLLILIFLISLLSTCKDDNSIEPYSYSKSCGMVPLQKTFGTDRIFIPNIFTPNNDGFNDFVLIFGTFSTINSFIIKDKNGLTVFEKNDFAPFDLAWDGTDFNGNLLIGGFDYDISITTSSSQIENFSGKIFSHECGNPNISDDNLSNCGFGSQHNGQGGWDASSPNNESNCL